MGDPARRAQVHVRIDVELAEWLELEAERRVVSRTFLVEQALRQLRDRTAAADRYEVRAS